MSPKIFWDNVADMIGGEYVQYPDEFRGDLWISEKVIDKVHNYIPLDKEEIVKIIIKCFPDI